VYSACYLLIARNSCPILFTVNQTSVELSVGLCRSYYKLPYLQEVTGGLHEFVDSEFKVGWGESREVGELGNVYICMNRRFFVSILYWK